jgi:maltose alpha-D-glucosyltransferase/alpha-amylase
MSIHSEPTPDRYTIAVFETEGKRRWIQDAPTDAAFRDFLVVAGNGAAIEGQTGRFEFEPWTLDGEPFALDATTLSSATAFEQSNTSIAYGVEAIAKLYRRLEAGQNIEVDMNRYLAAHAGFESVPKLIGCATYRGDAGELPLALIQQHVGDHRDCWTALTELLRHRAAGSLDIVAGLGMVTGEMHVALAAAPEKTPLAPEPVSADDIADWKRLFLRSAEETDWITGERLAALPDRSQLAAREYLASPRDWNERARGFEPLAETFKTRVHGDYHLGQVLITKDGRLLVVDFEGEPQRPAYEREAKYSPLKDVAGMLRSLNYATGVVASSLDVEAVAGSRRWLEQWEQEARSRFLSAYRRAIESTAVPIAPKDELSFERAVAALETDKAFYEVRYELSSRPDWAWLPIASLT